MEEMLFGFIHDKLYYHIVLIAVCIGATLLAMTVDLVVGVIKARARGEARTSTGYKKTATKAMKYFTPFFVLCCIDLLCSVVVPYPVFSMIWTCYCVFCEFISVREKSWEKAELRKMEKTMNVVIDNKEDLMKVFAKLITEQLNENKNGKQGD